MCNVVGSASGTGRDVRRTATGAKPRQKKGADHVVRRKKEEV